MDSTQKSILMGQLIALQGQATAGQSLVTACKAMAGVPVITPTGPVVLPVLAPLVGVLEQQCNLNLAVLAFLGKVLNAL